MIIKRCSHYTMHVHTSWKVQDCTKFMLYLTKTQNHSDIYFRWLLSLQFNIFITFIWLINWFFSVISLAWYIENMWESHSKWTIFYQVYDYFYYLLYITFTFWTFMISVTASFIISRSQKNFNDLHDLLVFPNFGSNTFNFFIIAEVSISL